VLIFSLPVNTCMSSRPSGAIASGPQETLAFDIIRTLRGHGFQAFLVGGCVRDRLLGLYPKDFDVSTDAAPSQLIQLFPNAQLVGAHFGVILVRGNAGAEVEVASFRSEGDYVDGRRPGQVKFETEPAADARRRDFTINGLFEDPISGRVYDYVGGQEDLKSRTVRAIGDARLRFNEDHLRLLRAVRFAARLNFSIETSTMAAMQDVSPKICRVSPERIREELLRILTEGGARYGFELLDESGLLPQVLPEVEAFKGVQQPAQYHPEGDVWQHVLLMLNAMQQPTPTLAWGVLLHDVGKPPTFRVAERIRFDGHAEVGADMARDRLNALRASNEEVDQVVSLVANHMRFKDVRQMRLSTLKRFLRLPHFDEHLELHRLDCLASNGYTDSYEFVKEQREKLQEEQLRPERLITGRDLIQEGYQPGPIFARTLEAIENAQLEGEIASKEDALTLARRVFQQETQERV
jgi:putative nucleotidyltransferase with HDIG domain